MGSRMVQYVHFFLFLAIMTVSAHGQEVRGTVLDSTGAVVANATVQLLSSGNVISQTQTSATGQFSVQIAAHQKQAGPTTYQIAVMAGGFATASRNIRLDPSEDVRLSVVLEVAADLESVDVNERLPAYKDRFDINEVRDSPARDLGEALTALDGVWKIRKAGIANDLVIRGFQQNNINVIVDGSRTYGACPGHMDPAIQHVDFAEVERVELTKGVFDVEHQGSLGATVNVITKTPGIGLRVTPSFAAGSFGYYNPSITASYGKQSFRVLGGYSYRTSDPYTDGAGRSFTSYANYSLDGANHKAFDANTGWMNVEFMPASNQRLTIGYTRQQAGLILYPYETMDANHDNADRAVVKYAVTDLSSTVRNVRIETYFTQVKHLMSNELRTSAMGGTWTMMANAASRVIGGTVEADIGRDFTFGMEGYYRNWNMPGYMRMGGMLMVNQTLPDVGTRTFGSFINYHHALSDKLHLSGGARFDHAAMQVMAANATTDLYYTYHDTHRISNHDNYASGNLRLTATLPGSTEFFIGAGSSGRLPDAEERYISRGMGQGANVGDPSLPITRNTEISTGLVFKRGRSYVRPDLFYSSLTDYIIVNDQPSVNNMGGMGTMTARSYTNVDARIYGGEIGYAVALTNPLSLSGGISYTRGTADQKISDGVLSTRLPEMPPLRTWAALRYVYKTIFAEIGGTGVRQQLLVNTDLQETPTAGYGLMNLKLGFMHRKFSGSFSVDNLLNHYYYEHLSYYRDPFASGVRVPEPGRNFFVQVKYAF
jgi:iron complex outermembrane recepter protein